MNLEAPLRVFALAFFFNFVSHMRGTFLAGLRQLGAIFRNQLAVLIRKWAYFRELLGYRRPAVRTALRLLAWAAHTWFRAPAWVRFREWNMALALPPYWCGVQKLIFLFRESYEFELSYLHRNLRAGDVVVDAGACLGIYSILASKCIGDSGCVLAFEPAAQSFEMLRRNLDLNRTNNVRTFRLALSDREGGAVLYHYPDPGSNSFGQANTAAGSAENVSTASLDDILAREGVKKVDVIKMDVEGAEELVLRGAASTIAASHPAIIFEINPPAALRQSLPADGVWRRLAGLGYEFFAAEPSGKLTRLQRPPRSGNVVATYNKAFETEPGLSPAVMGRGCELPFSTTK